MSYYNFVLWLTGLPCSGKTTIAQNISELLQKSGHKIKLLDGDDFRKNFCPHLGFSSKERDDNIKKAIIIAKKFFNEGNTVICSFVSPYKHHREKAKEILGRDNFIEVFINAPLSVCERRDIKKMYKRAREGKISNFTGLDDIYELPTKPDIILYTDKENKEESVKKIINFLKKKKIEI